jgi:hypothetical protein
MISPILIREYMEVLGSDGEHVGTVDHIEGVSEIKLAKDDADAGGEHHYIPLSWIMHVGMKIHLRQTGADAKAQWVSH